MTSAITPYKLNPDASNGWLTNIKNYFDGEGAYRAQKCSQSYLALAAQLFSSDSLQKAAEVFGAGAAGITIPYAGSTTIGAYQAAGKLASGVTRPRVLDFFQKACDSISMVSYSVLSFTGSAVAKLGGDVFSACADVGDVAIASNRLVSLNSVPVKGISKEAKAAIGEEENLFQIKLFKAATAVAFVALGVFSLVSNLVLAVIFAVSNTFAVIGYFYDKNRTYNDDQLVDKIKVLELGNPDKSKEKAVWSRGTPVCTLA